MKATVRLFRSSLRVRLRSVHRKKRIRKHVVGHPPPLSDAFCLVERAVNTEINSALAVFLFRLRKRGKAACYKWPHIAAVVARESVEFVGDKREGDLICPIKFAQGFEKRAAEAGVS
jgi:hypothetical protein